MKMELQLCNYLAYQAVRTKAHPASHVKSLMDARRKASRKAYLLALSQAFNERLENSAAILQPLPEEATRKWLGLR